MNVINRNYYLEKLTKSRGNGLIKVITGPRRCGKSFLLTKLFHSQLLSEGIREDHIIEISLEDMAFYELRNPFKMMEYVRNKITAEGQYYIIIDEVQRLDEFVDVLNSLLRIHNVDVFVTGSNSRFLSSDIATEFRGRDHQIRLHPLSFAEFYSAIGGDKEDAWLSYCTYGGLPQVLSFEDAESKANYLRSVYQTAYLSDILERYKIKNVSEFDKLVQILASQIGSPNNPNKISNTFQSVEGVAIHGRTIGQYLSYLTDAFIVNKAERYDVKGRKYIGTLSKYYFEDLGIRNALLNFRQQEESHIMENVLYNELLARGYQVDVGDVEIRKRNEAGESKRTHLEIDFVVNDFSKRYYIQSALSIPDRDKLEQESQSLLNIKDAFRKIIIVKSRTIPWHTENGILVISLIDFLLGKVDLDT